MTSKIQLKCHFIKISQYEPSKNLPPITHVSPLGPESDKKLIFVALTGFLCGCNDWVDVERFAKARESWLAKHLRLPFDIASHDTFSRVFSRLDTAQFLVAMHTWVDDFAGSLRGQRVAIDGKVMRGSFDKAAGQSPLHLIHRLCDGDTRCLAFFDAHLGATSLSFGFEFVLTFNQPLLVAVQTHADGLAEEAMAVGEVTELNRRSRLETIMSVM